jgi:phosphoribosylglycinamide formyltransferase-1
MKVGILFSGRGSNMQSIIGCSTHDSAFDVVCAITDNPEAGGIDIAKDYDIPVSIIHPRNDNTSKRDWFESLTTTLRLHNVELVVLAGFMKVLDKQFCRDWQNRCINIHPSLLPDYKGLHTHQRVLDANEQWSGCTIHFVTSELDDGPIIAQEKVRVCNGDSADILANRILSYEHILYPAVVSKICSGDIVCRSGEVYQHSKNLHVPLDINSVF